MSYQTIIARLYYMLIYTKANVNDREIASTKHMIGTEGFIENHFHAEMEGLWFKDQEMLIAECIVAMRQLDHALQVRIVAWLCIAANADGCMEKSEWHFIYRIYHQELNLPLDEIFIVQKQLSQRISLPFFQSLHNERRVRQ
jgi:hypothetical protein